jgi:hypothetical protein
LRKQKGLTQEELAEFLYVSRTAISKWESGRGYRTARCEVLTIAEEDQKRNVSSRLGIWLDIVFMVVGRLISGVHWLTDIIGGAIRSAGLVRMYESILKLIGENDDG